MTSIIVRCPSCAKIGYLTIEENLVRNSSRGVTAVNVEEDIVCRHSFIAYIDNNLILRDAFIADFTVELPKLKVNKEDAITIDDVPDDKMIDIYSISMNINALTLTYFLKGGMNNKKIIYLNDLDVLNTYLINLLHFIYKDSFKIDISIEPRNSYKKKKREFKDYIVFSNDKLHNNQTKFINPKMLKIERAIIQKFLAEQDTKESLIILRNEIRKAYILAKDLSEKISELKGTEEQEKIDAKTFYGFLEEKYNIKLTLPYVKFLIEILENYFNVQLPMVWKFFLLRL